MSGFSDYLEQAVLNATLRGQAFVPPLIANLRLALFTGDPGDSGASNEVNTDWYARQVASGWSAPGTTGTGNQSTNTSTVTFDPLTADITLTHAGLFDSLSGNLLYPMPFPAPRIMFAGDVLTFPPGTLAILLD